MGGKLGLVGFCIGFFSVVIICAAAGLDSMLLIMFLGLVAGIIFFILFLIIEISLEDKAKKGKQDKLSQCCQSVKDGISKVKANLGSELRLTRDFMDENQVQMILYGDDRKFYCFKDRRCGFITLDSLTGSVNFLLPNVVLQEHVSTNYTYQDPKLVYTGATVGGVTTGGFHVEKGRYIENGRLTGKYGHFVKIGNEHVYILRIYLNSELWKTAKSNRCMKKFIYNKNEYISLVHPHSKKTQEQLRLAASTGDTSLDGLFASVQERATIEIYLTKDEAVKVRDWIYKTMNDCSGTSDNPNN